MPINIATRRALLNSSVVGWSPDPTDANTWGWWDVDNYVVTNAPGDVVSWGNRMASQVDKTDITDATNFSGGGGMSNKPVLSRTDTLGNWVRASENMAAASVYTAASATINSATLATFTAQNGAVYQPVPFTQPGVTYRLRIKIKRITGNTAIQLYHAGSATGDSVNITIDGTSTEYTTTFLGHATYGNVNVGVRDANALGQGQVELLEWQVTDNVGWSTTYIANPSSWTPVVPLASGARAIYNNDGSTLSWGTYFIHNYAGTHAALAQPLTFYLCFMPQRIAASRSLWDNINPTWATYCDFNPTDESIYTNANPFARIDRAVPYVVNTWRVVTAVYNGASSLVRVNKTAAVTGTLGALGGINKGFILGSSAFAGVSCGIAISAFMIRTVADSTATQNTYIEYFAGKVGLIV
jgi:hypothetical protein